MRDPGTQRKLTRTGPRPGQLTALLHELVRTPHDGAAPGWEHAPAPGTVVGRFELVREIGRGGFGIVYEARDHELGRHVAFKALRADHRPDVSEERLLREAEAAAQLSHPNIVTLFDVGRSDRGPWLVLELLEGRTLASQLRDEPHLAVADAVHVATEIARALAHAHAHGVVHRDLKPANVFVCSDGRVKVLDFGLAHAFGHRRAAGGTPGYMAPEQAEDAPEDERSDVWALGVILFEMLSGRRPFEDQRSLEKGAPPLDVPGAPGLADLVARMLARNPRDRPRDGAEVLAILQGIERQVAAAPSPAIAPVRVRRRGLAPGWLLAVAVVAAALAGIAGWGLRARRAAMATGSTAPITLAVLPLANLSGDPAQEYFSDGVTEEITGKLSRLRGLAVLPRSSVARYKGTPKDAREIGKESGAAYAVEGSVRRVGDRIRMSAALVRTADATQVWSEILEARVDDVFEVQERFATRIVEALQIHLTPDEAGSLGKWGTRNAAAYDAYLRGQALVQRVHLRENLEGARVHFERALQIDAGFAPAMVGLGYAEAVIHRNYEPSPQRLAKARALLDRALVIDPNAPRALLTSGVIRVGLYDYRGALADFRRFTVIEPRDYEGWGGVCFMLGYVTPPEAVEAERACRRSLELYPDGPRVYYYLSRALLPQGRIAEAERAIEELERRSPGAEMAWGGRFWIQLASNRPREALQALAHYSKTYQDGGLATSWRAMALAQAGDIDAAFTTLDRALANGWRDVDQLRLGPWLEPLRGDARFPLLLAKHGITDGSAR